MASTRATVEDKKNHSKLCLTILCQELLNLLRKKVAMLQEDLIQFNLKGINVGIRRS